MLHPYNTDWVLEQCSQYSNRVMDLTVLGSNPSREKKFFFSKTLRWALVTTQPPIQWVQGKESRV